MPDLSGHRSPLPIRGQLINKDDPDPPTPADVVAWQHAVHQLVSRALVEALRDVEHHSSDASKLLARELQVPQLQVPELRERRKLVAGDVVPVREVEQDF